jgi:hypothetical protein
VALDADGEVVMVRLEPLAAEHATWLGEFLVSDDWPFHAGTVDQDLVIERLRQGYHDGPGRATFLVTGGAQQVGLVRVEDLDDDTHDVDRLEGTTRQDNVAMRRTFRAVGFVKEAHYGCGWPARDGRLLDAVGYALLRTDWREGTTTLVDWDDEPDAVYAPFGV